jgi:hypothetical protein
MAWLDIFKKKKNKIECFICSSKNAKADMIEIKYRYGAGQGTIGVAHMCNKCNDKYTVKSEDEDYAESL